MVRTYTLPSWASLAVIVIAAAIAALSILFVVGSYQAVQPPKAEPCVYTEFSDEISCVDSPVSTGLGGGWK